jgi:hypothetical protein
MPPAGIEPKIPASERPQTYALDHAATGIGDVVLYRTEIQSMNSVSETHFSPSLGRKGGGKKPYLALLDDENLRKQVV